MKRRYLSFLWSIPFLIFLVCTLLVIVIQHIVGDTLRTLPEIGLTWFGVVSIEMLILWGSRTLQAFRYGQESTSLRVVKVVTIILSIAVSCCLIGAAIFVSGYAYTPEHVVIRNDIKMVARVSSFLDEQVDYYQYKNVFFYGKELGYEYYGIKDDLYIDDGVSGVTFNHPGFNAMIAEIEAGNVGTVICKDMSRLGRNYLQVGFYTELHLTRAQNAYCI